MRTGGKLSRAKIGPLINRFVDIKILRAQKHSACYSEQPISDSLFLLALATIFEDE